MELGDKRERQKGERRETERQRGRERERQTIIFKAKRE